jgi:2-methylfumaryl-CoA hydratase
MINAPWFEDFTVGDDFSDVPSVTLTDGYAALHQSMFADRSRLSLDRMLCEKVTGQNAQLVNSSLLCNMAIGQSTVPSQRVMGNLFYRGLVIQRPVFIGDTLTTRTRVVAMKQNRIRPGRAASGMVVLEIDVRNQRDETVMHFWRCPMIPCKSAEADTGCNDDFDQFPIEISPGDLASAVPDWNYAAFSNAVSGKNFSDYAIADEFEVDARDTVTSAPELVRFTLNLAMTHTDASRSVYGKRLVYGGHTISIAAAQVVRAVPNLLATLAWYHCDHVAPVFEGDILRSVVRVIDTIESDKAAGVLRMHVEVFADRGDQAPEPGSDIKVLDWQLAGLLAG